MIRNMETLVVLFQMKDIRTRFEERRMLSLAGDSVEGVHYGWFVDVT